MIDKRKFYINGTWVNPSIKNDSEVINPSNEEPYAFISLGSKEDVDLAVNAAKKAFLTWSQVDKKQKISLLEKLLEVYNCLLYTSPSPRDLYRSRMPSSA